MTTSTNSRVSIFRLAAAAAVAAIALTACNPTSGETTIGGTTTVVDSAVVVAAEETPIESTETTVANELVPVEATETAATTDLIPVEEPDETDVETSADLEPGVFVDVPEPVDEEADATDGDSTEAAEATETAAFNVTGANCLDGRWIAAPGEIQLYFDTIGLANGIDMNGSGHLIIVLENGNYTYDARIVNEIVIDGFPTTSVVDGVTRGNYTYENGFIVANETAGSLDAYVDLGGTRIDASDLGEDFSQMGAFHEAPYDCNGDNPSIYFDVAPGVARYEMKFIPWDGTRP